MFYFMNAYICVVITVVILYCVICCTVYCLCCDMNVSVSAVFTVVILYCVICCTSYCLYLTMNASGESLVRETIRQVMAARAIHNVFKMSEFHLVVAHDSVKYVFQVSIVTRESSTDILCKFSLLLLRAHAVCSYFLLSIYIPLVSGQHHVIW